MSQLPVVQGVTARYMGPYVAAGSVSNYYWIQAVYPDGLSKLSAYGVATDCAAGLSPWSFVNVEWTPAPGAIGYLVYSNQTGTTPTNGSILRTIADAQTSFKDVGQAAISATIRYDSVYVYKAIYNFAVDGGVAGAIIPAVSDTIPIDALVIGGVINSTTAVTSGGSATISVGTSAGSSATQLLGATAKSSFSSDAVIVTLASTAPFKMSAAGQINITVGTSNLTAGVIEIFALAVFPTNP